MSSVKGRKLATLGAALVTLASWVGAVNTCAGEVKSDRVALVVGNGHYLKESSDTALTDATALSQRLTELGFTVECLLDAPEVAMKEAAARFSARLGPTSVGVFFFAGHAVQLLEHNYLLPVDAVGVTLADLQAKTFDLALIYESFRKAGNPMNLVFLDACRTNPLLAAAAPAIPSRAALRALAWPKNAPTGTVIAFATAPSKDARADHDGIHSPFTKALLKYLGEPGLELHEYLQRVRRTVLEYTDDDQEVWENSVQLQQFYFRDPVDVQIALTGVDDDLFVFLNAGQARIWSRDGSSPLPVRLAPGQNVLSAYVYNQHTTRGGIGLIPEGWKYALTCSTTDGRVLLKWAGGEDVPKKDGPHHGKLFNVANATIQLDPLSAEVTVAATEPDVWRTDFSVLVSEDPVAIHHIAMWSIANEGVRVFDDSYPGNRRASADLRNDIRATHRTHAAALKILDASSPEELDAVIAAVTTDPRLEAAIRGNLHWVLFHERLAAEMEADLKAKKFEDIRSRYLAAEGHNHEVGNLLAALSNRELEGVVESELRAAP